MILGEYRLARFFNQPSCKLAKVDYRRLLLAFIDGEFIPISPSLPGLLPPSDRFKRRSDENQKFFVCSLFCEFTPGPT